jgi:predicted ArsR family transcriptional regulator
MTTVRQGVFAYLQKHQVASATDISRDLGMTGANARHHLSILAQQGLIEVVGQRTGAGRGRPVKLYGPVRSVLGDNLGRLAGELLSEWLEDLPEDEKEKRLRSLAKRLASGKESDEGAPVTRRLTMTTEQMNKLGYRARWEAHAEGPRLILGGCPYAAIIAEHPELCQMDAALLEEGLAAPVRQTAKLEGGEGGRPYCAFLVGRLGV